MMDLPDDLRKSIERLLASAPADFDMQVEREIVRYWNDRIKGADQADDQLRALRVMVFNRLAADR